MVGKSSTNRFDQDIYGKMSEIITEIKSVVDGIPQQNNNETITTLIATLQQQITALQQQLFQQKSLPDLTDIHTNIAALRTNVSTLRTDFGTELGSLRQRLDSQNIEATINNITTGLDTRINELNTLLQTQDAKLEEEIQSRPQKEQEIIQRIQYTIITPFIEQTTNTLAQIQHDLNQKVSHKSFERQLQAECEIMKESFNKIHTNLEEISQNLETKADLQTVQNDLRTLQEELKTKASNEELEDLYRQFNEEIDNIINQMNTLLDKKPSKDELEAFKQQQVGILGHIGDNFQKDFNSAVDAFEARLQYLETREDLQESKQVLENKIKELQTIQTNFQTQIDKATDKTTGIRYELENSIQPILDILKANIRYLQEQIKDFEEKEGEIKLNSNTRVKGIRQGKPGKTLPNVTNESNNSFSISSSINNEIEENNSGSQQQIFSNREARQRQNQERIRGERKAERNKPQKNNISLKNFFGNTNNNFKNESNNENKEKQDRNKKIQQNLNDTTLQNFERFNTSLPKSLKQIKKDIIRSENITELNGLKQKITQSKNKNFRNYKKSFLNAISAKTRKIARNAVSNKNIQNEIFRKFQEQEQGQMTTTGQEQENNKYSEFGNIKNVLKLKSTNNELENNENEVDVNEKKQIFDIIDNKIKELKLSPQETYYQLYKYAERMLQGNVNTQGEQNKAVFEFLIDELKSRIPQKYFLKETNTKNINSGFKFADTFWKSLPDLPKNSLPPRTQSMNERNSQQKEEEQKRLLQESKNIFNSSSNSDKEKVILSEIDSIKYKSNMMNDNQFNNRIKGIREMISKVYNENRRNELTNLLEEALRQSDIGVQPFGSSGVSVGSETKKSLRNMNVKELGSEKDRINNLIKEIENKRQQSNYSTISSMEKAQNINKINKYRKNLKNIETLLTSSSSNTQESTNNTNLWEIGIQRLPSNEKKKFITNEIALINSEIEIIRNNLEDISKKFINKEINSSEYNTLKDNYNYELEEQMKKMDKLTSFLKSIKKGGYRKRKTQKKHKKSKRKTFRKHK